MAETKHDAADVERAYFDALRAGYRRRAFAVVDDARANGMDVQGLYMDVRSTDE